MLFRNELYSMVMVNCLFIRLNLIRGDFHVGNELRRNFKIS